MRFDLLFAVILGTAEMHPVVRVILGHAEGWARCPLFVLAELSTSVSPAGLSATAMLMGLAMIIAGLRAQRRGRGPPALCEQWRDVPAQRWPSPLSWTPVLASSVVGSSLNNASPVGRSWWRGIRRCHCYVRTTGVGQHHATQLVMPLLFLGFTPKPKPLAAKAPHSEQTSSPALPKGVPGQGHLSSIPVLALLTSSLPKVWRSL